MNCGNHPGPIWHDIPFYHHSCTKYTHVCNRIHALFLVHCSGSHALIVSIRKTFSVQGHDIVHCPGIIYRDIHPRAYLYCAVVMILLHVCIACTGVHPPHCYVTTNLILSQISLSMYFFSLSSFVPHPFHHTPSHQIPTLYL